jgi:hypothetical protein
MSDPDPRADSGVEPGSQPTAEVQESNPNAGGPPGLSGGMGVSSERTGPLGDDPAVAGVQGTGSHGTASEGTDGVSATSRAEVAEAPGPEMDDTQQEATQSWRDGQPAAGGDQPNDAAHDAGPSRATGIDRTVGEANPAEVPAHESDPRKNPGHSHGA